MGSEWREGGRKAGCSTRTCLVLWEQRQSEERHQPSLCHKGGMTFGRLDFGGVERKGIGKDMQDPLEIRLRQVVCYWVGAGITHLA